MTTKARALIPFVLAAGLALAGCADAGAGESTAEESTASSPTPDASTPTPTQEAPAPSPTASPSPESSTTAFPPPAQSLEQGQLTWAVVLAGSADAADPRIVEATGVAAEAGYVTGFTDCDQGAAEALGIDGSGTGVGTVSVYLDGEADARQALQAFEERGWSGGVVAEVTTYCLD